MLKKVLATVLLGATLAIPVTSVSLLTNTTKANAAVDCIQVIETSYDKNNGWYKFKFKVNAEPCFTGVKLQYAGKYGPSEENIALGNFYNVVYGNANEQQVGNKLLRREGNAFILEIRDNDYISSVTARFGYSWRWINFETAPVTVNQIF